MTTHIATVCDKNYLVRALALYNSVCLHMPEAKMWFLCMDDETKTTITKLNLANSSAKLVSEINDPELIAVRNTRTNGEFAMSSKASWLLYIFNSGDVGPLDVVIYIDADILLFNSLQSLITKMKNDNKSIGITPHRFPKSKKNMSDEVGVYNSGFELFIVDDNSRAYIEDWRRLCIEWCYLRRDDHFRLGDQKYLNYWPSQFSGVYEIEKGVNTGSWNLSSWVLTRRDGSFFIDEDPLLCYHFHRIQFYIYNGSIKPLPIFIFNKELYAVYVKCLEHAWSMVLSIDPDWKYGFVERPNMLRLAKQAFTRYIRNLKQRYAW